MKANSPAKVIGLDSYRDHENDGQHLISISKLALRLQQSIEITPLLNTFCEETASIVPCDSVEYVNNNSELKYSTGESQSHLCRYKLELENEDLGEVICSRAKPFTMKETNLIERLLSLLIYPLRNALLYRQAITQAHRDPLTQISNRAAFDESMSKQLASYERHQTDFSLLIIDIDHFKKVNDSYGHITGDGVLKLVAKVIKTTIRGSDEVFRYGGEEFVVILGNTSQAGANFIAERVRKQIQQEVVDEGKNIRVTASIGVAASDKVEDPTEILEFADKALYKAKDMGRNKVVNCA